MDISYKAFIMHARAESAASGGAITVRRSSYGTIRPGDRRRAPIWTITNTRIGVSVQVPEAKDLMPAAEAMALSQKLQIAPHPDLAREVPSFTVANFTAYLKSKGVKVTFDPRQGGYKLKAGVILKRRAFLAAPGREGDPEFAAGFLVQAVNVCLDLQVAYPHGLGEEGGLYEEARLADHMAAQNPNVRAGREGNFLHYSDISDDTIQPDEVPEDPIQRGWIAAGYVVRLCNAVRVQVPDDLPPTRAMPLFLGRARTRGRMATDAIAAARTATHEADPTVDMDNADTEIIEVSEIVERHSAARSNGKTLGQAELRKQKEAEDPERKGEDPDHDHQGGGDSDHGSGEVSDGPGN